MRGQEMERSNFLISPRTRSVRAALELGAAWRDCGNLSQIPQTRMQMHPLSGNAIGASPTQEYPAARNTDPGHSHPWRCTGSGVLIMGNGLLKWLS